VPVRLRFGKVLRTFTVHVRAHSDVVVDRLSSDVAGNRGCAGSGPGRSSGGGDCRHGGSAALAELLARVDGCYLNKTDRQRRKNCCLVCLGRWMVFEWLKMIECLSCSSNSNCTGSESP